MSENSQSSTQKWLTFAQAAAILGISDRAVQKRCAAGKLAAQRVETAQGARWEIDAHQITRTDEPSARTLDASQDANRRTKASIGHESAKQRSTFHAENEAKQDANRRTEVPELDASQDENQANAQDDFHAHLLEENRFLRGLVEQHQRSGTSRGTSQSVGSHAEADHKR